jgi:hypothetical protein
MTLVSPSYKEACSARDASRECFDKPDLSSNLGKVTVRNDTEHLGRTVVTVRNYLTASTAAAHSEIDALDKDFAAASGSKSESDITRLLQDLDRLFAKTEAFIEGMLNPQFPEASLSDAKKLIDEARGDMTRASNSELVHDTRCTSAQAALRLLGKSMKVGFNSLEGHMKAAQDSYRDMADENNMVPKTADMLKSQGETVLRSLDTVLQHGLDAKPEKFDMDGFVQLLDRQNALGSTISSAASRYSASGPEIRDFVGHISDADTLQTAREVATEMFTNSNDRPIDLGSYLSEIIARTSENLPTAQEALKEALKYMIPIKVGDRYIPESPATG